MRLMSLRPCTSCTPAKRWGTFRKLPHVRAGRRSDEADASVLASRTAHGAETAKSSAPRQPRMRHRQGACARLASDGAARQTQRACRRQQRRSGTQALQFALRTAAFRHSSCPSNNTPADSPSAHWQTRACCMARKRVRTETRALRHAQVQWGRQGVATTAVLQPEQSAAGRCLPRPHGGDTNNCLDEGANLHGCANWSRIQAPNSAHVGRTQRAPRTTAQVLASVQQLAAQHARQLVVQQRSVELTDLPEGMRERFAPARCVARRAPVRA